MGGLLLRMMLGILWRFRTVVIKARTACRMLALCCVLLCALLWYTILVPSLAWLRASATLLRTQISVRVPILYRQYRACVHAGALHAAAALLRCALATMNGLDRVRRFIAAVPVTMRRSGSMALLVDLALVVEPDLLHTRRAVFTLVCKVIADLDLLVSATQVEGTPWERAKIMMRYWVLSVAAVFIVLVVMPVIGPLWLPDFAPFAGAFAIIQGVHAIGTRYTNRIAHWFQPEDMPKWIFLVIILLAGIQIPANIVGIHLRHADATAFWVASGALFVSLVCLMLAVAAGVLSGYIGPLLRLFYRRCFAGALMVNGLVLLHVDIERRIIMGAMIALATWHLYIGTRGPMGSDGVGREFECGRRVHYDISLIAGNLVSHPAISIALPRLPRSIDVPV